MIISYCDIIAEHTVRIGLRDRGRGASLPTVVGALPPSGGRRATRGEDGNVATQSGPVVRVHALNRVATITIDYPPVNALGAAVRAGLLDALTRCRQDPEVDCIVLRGARGSFVAGADIREFGQPPQPPSAIAVFDAIENLNKPIAAAIDGVALGGGLELALVCHYRVAAPRSKLGLPEIKLGILPGAGGTQRLPRLIGFGPAAAMILSGDPISAAEALRLGLIDAIGTDDVGATAVLVLDERGGAKAALRKVRDLEPQVRAARSDPGTLEAALSAHLKRARNRRAAAACAQALRAAASVPFDEGLALERKLFVDLRDSAESKAQRYLFFAERAAAKISGKAAEAEARPVASAAIIGGGTMGSGIAMCFANAGIPVTVIDRDEASIKRCLDTITANYRKTAERGGLGTEEVAARLELIAASVQFNAAAAADVIIEAVFEEMPLKKEVFARLDAIAKPGAVLATNTSTLDVNKIATATRRPESVVGMHFFSPAHVMRLLEIVDGKATAPAVLRTAIVLGKRLEKASVVVGVCDGFVGNRMGLRRGAHVERMMQEGILPQDIDRVSLDFGFAMGPCATADLAGLDIGWRIRRAKGRSAPIADWLCEQGRFGQKVGKGYYRYEAGSRMPIVEPAVTAFIQAKAKELGHPPRVVSDQEILDRMLLPMINEGARILEEKIARCAGDIDVIWATGYGWPVWRGGPMYYADQVRLTTVRERLTDYAARLKDDSLKPAHLIDTLVRAGQSFADLFSGGPDERGAS
ncbi:MAG: 3-hydroxyacyl-CoA dehydrogenase [Alphaproteobacteria bacterium]|nr:3-hydroxyacyl-CoA dehydrogenase [Alphaproteobacteria bacterium]